MSKFENMSPRALAQLQRDLADEATRRASADPQAEYARKLARMNPNELADEKYEMFLKAGK